MTSPELIERSLRLLNPSPTREQAVALRSMLGTQIENALRLLAEKAIATGLLRKTFTVTATAGEAALTTPLTATEPLMLEGLRHASIFITGYTYAAQWRPDRASLMYDQTAEFPYWTLENQTIVIKDTALGNYAGTVTIRNAPYVPALSSVPVTLEPLLVELLARTSNAPTQVSTTN